MLACCYWLGCVLTIGFAQAVFLRVYFHGDIYSCDVGILDTAEEKCISLSLFARIIFNLGLFPLVHSGGGYIVLC